MVKPLEQALAHLFLRLDQHFVARRDLIFPCLSLFASDPFLSSTVLANMDSSLPPSSTLARAHSNFSTGFLPKCSPRIGEVNASVSILS